MQPNGVIDVVLATKIVCVWCFWFVVLPLMLLLLRVAGPPAEAQLLAPQAPGLPLATCLAPARPLEGLLGAVEKLAQATANGRTAPGRFRERQSWRLWVRDSQSVASLRLAMILGP